MRRDTKRRKKASKMLQEMTGAFGFARRVERIIQDGKRAVDTIQLELGRMLVEAVMYCERETIAGPDYNPKQTGTYKWGSQPGSVYIGDQKMPVEHPRVRDVKKGEIELESYKKLSDPGQFSDEILGQLLRGLSGRRYHETVINAAEAFGVSPGSISRHTAEASARQLKEFRERRFYDFKPFAMMMDTVHRGGMALIVALVIDTEGKKTPLGFWEGASESHTLCKMLITSLVDRGLSLHEDIIWVTDGGGGIIKELKDRFGKKLFHVRCFNHKSKNIQRHLRKEYRQVAHGKFKTALQHESYEDAKKSLEEFEVWLRVINASAADSLLEAFDELLTLHRIGVPAELRRVLWTSNGIESMFSIVRDCESNVKNHGISAVSQRRLATSLIQAETSFHRIKGRDQIKIVLQRIARLRKEEQKNVLTFPAGNKTGKVKPGRKAA